jgi:hypothetical protein
LPVPDLAQFRPPSNGNRLAGIVVGIETRSHPRKKEPLWTIDLYDGKSLYRIQVNAEFALGAYLRGEVTYVQDVGTFLKNAVQYLPPGYSEQAEADAEADIGRDPGSS